MRARLVQCLRSSWVFVLASHVPERCEMIRIEELRSFKVRLVSAVAGMCSWILSLAKVRSCFCSISKFSSCRAWMELVAGARKWEGAAACIGSTSATAARKAGLTRIFYPESPGIEGCVISSQTLPFPPFQSILCFRLQPQVYNTTILCRQDVCVLQNFVAYIVSLLFLCMHLLESISF